MNLAASAGLMILPSPSSACSIVTARDASCSPAAATTSTKPSAAGGDHIARDVDICVELSWVLRDVAKVDRQVTEACHAYIRAERAAPALAAARRDVARAEQDVVAATKRQRHVAHESGGSEKQAAVARLEKELKRASADKET